MTHEDDVQLSRKAVIQRGLFVHRYSGIEFAMCELIMRARTSPAYHDLGDMPFRYTGKIQWVRKMLDRQGPVRPYASGIRVMLRDFLPFEEIRHFMMHGLMTIEHGTPEGDVLRFEMYDRIEGNVSKGTLRISLERLKAVVADMGKISNNFPEYVSIVCQGAELGEFPMDEPRPRTFKRPQL